MKNKVLKVELKENAKSLKNEILLLQRFFTSDKKLLSFKQEFSTLYNNGILSYYVKEDINSVTVVCTGYYKNIINVK